ncbi:MAG: GNAT family N-acetyltransferase [Chloroflexota bacterium]
MTAETVYSELLTPRLRLSPVSLADLPDLQALFGQSEVARYLPGGEPYPPEVMHTELESMLAHWQQHDYGMFAIRSRETEAFLGYCGVQHLHAGPGGVSPAALERYAKAGEIPVEILYGLTPGDWGQGLASEAGLACLRYAFEVLELPQVTAAIHPDNAASKRILVEKLGLRPAPGLDFYGDCPHFALERQAYQPGAAPLFNLSTDPARLDIEAICAFLQRAYWAQGRRRETVERSLQHSLCFGVYDRQVQIGLARLVTDFATFAWLCDVFIDEAYRGHGLGKWLVKATLSHPELQSLRRWMLATRDAHGLYRQFGYQPLSAPERWMERFNSQAS